MNKDSKIFVAGHNGMVGSSIVRLLKKEGFSNIVTASRTELDLIDQQQVNSFFKNIKPDFVFLAAARVGGIKANNDFRADFIYQNLMIQTNVIHASHKNNVKKLVFLGSSCIYPKLCEQPIKEEYLLSGYLEKTNDAYAVSKIAGIKMCQDYNEQFSTNFISLMPTNLYGPNDNYDLNNSHVLPALIRKFHEAKVNNQDSVEIWGTGLAKREFLHVDDLADACLFLIENYNSSEVINVGTGEDLSISDLAFLIKKIVGFQGEIHFNTNMMDGTPRKVLDISKLNNLGWTHKIPLTQGIKDTYELFQKTR